MSLWFSIDIQKQLKIQHPKCSFGGRVFPLVYTCCRECCVRSMRMVTPHRLLVHARTNTVQTERVIRAQQSFMRPAELITSKTFN